MFRVGSRGRRRARLRVGAVVAVLVSCSLAAVAPHEAAGAEKQPPLAHHATVTSGRITGSAFKIAKGIGVTNAHVLNGAQPGAEVSVSTGSGPSRRAWRARILAISPVMDLALIALPEGSLPIVPSADAPVTPGLAVKAAGVIAEARGPGHRMELSGTVLSGSVRIAPFGEGFVVAMPGIRRGFSGGPVLDTEGRLVGMIAALRPDPGPIRGAAGAPLAGREAFVLAAPLIRAEAARLLAAISGR
jgi:S1-C subfamily serine protease